MDILPIGYDNSELIFIKCEKLNVSIKGRASHPRIGIISSHEQISGLDISCHDFFQGAILGNKVESTVRQMDGEYCLKDYKIPPLFYEQQDYELIIETNEECVVEFWHENISIRNKVGPVGRSGRTWSGVFNFANDIGFSHFKINVNGLPYLTFTLEVFPTKISYREDYLRLMADVTDEVYNLAFEFIRKTYLHGKVIDNKGNSLTEFFSIIRTFYDELLRAVDIILACPHHALITTEEVLPAHKIKSGSKSTLKWLQKHPQMFNKNNGKLQIEKALVVKKKITYDTLENRYIKFILKSTIDRLNILKSHYERLNRQGDREILKMVDGMISGILRRKEHNFFNDISEFDSITSMSLVFAMAPGYKELYTYYLMLQKCLSLEGDVFHISVKDLAVLYEYWCFIKLNSILREQYVLIQQDIIKTDSNGLFVTLKKGSGSKVTYQNPKTGEYIELSYNPKTKASPTVSQKPDNVLSLRKNGSEGRYQYIFDAKYKINPALKGSFYGRTYETPGPEEEDINTMHRYRDAIVYENKKEGLYERYMFGAYILFPYHNEVEYADHKFFKSIDEVNVGGLPFLPRATRMVEKFLDELIMDSSQSAFERSVLPHGTVERLAAYELNKRDVLVGTVRDMEQFDINVKHKFYHIPATQVSETNFPIHYVALYQSKRIFGQEKAGIRIYGEVLRCSKVKRKEILELPKGQNADKWYYRFDIKQWITLNSPVKSLEFGPRPKLYTNQYLLEHCEYIPELCIQTSEEWRLYMELKRLSLGVKIQDNGDAASEFELDGTCVRIEAEKILVNSCDGNDYIYSLKDFKKCPRRIINKINHFR